MNRGWIQKADKMLVWAYAYCSWPPGGDLWWHRLSLVVGFVVCETSFLEEPVPGFGRLERHYQSKATVSLRILKSCIEKWPQLPVTQPESEMCCLEVFKMRSRGLAGLSADDGVWFVRQESYSVSVSWGCRCEGRVGSQRSDWALSAREASGSVYLSYIYLYIYIYVTICHLFCSGCDRCATNLLL